MRSPSDALSDFYRREAVCLEGVVARSVMAPRDVIQDACSYAWCQLVRRLGDIELGKSAFWWLHRVAVHEAWRLTTEARRHRAMGDPTEPAELGWIPAKDVTDGDARATLLAIAELPERKRRILLLHAAGFTYKEIARITGDSWLTVERQLQRAKQLIRDCDGRPLTRREQQVLGGLAAGATRARIAAELGVTKETVDDYIGCLYRKLGVKTRMDAVVAARRLGRPRVAP